VGGLLTGLAASRSGEYRGVVHPRTLDAIERATLESFEEGEGIVAACVPEVVDAPLERRERSYEALLARVDHRDPGCSAMFALAAGALIESGLDPEPLALAVVRPLTRTLSSARPFVDGIAKLPDADEGEPFGNRAVSEASFEALAKQEPAAYRAYQSLSIWYRPVVAAWTRCPAALRAVQSDEAFAGLLSPFVGDAMHWVAILLKVLFDAPFVAMFPELDSAYAFRASGCVDLGQMSVLLADALPGAFGEIGATPPERAVVAVMRGDGPQQVQARYTSEFHVYAWQAMHPETLMPRNGVYSWLAPGGAGDISLVGDFLPADVVASADGVRVLAVVGLGVEGASSYTRGIGGARAFSGLRASLDDVRPLGDDELAALKRALRAALADA
jgi:hypothetical protein